MAYFVGVKFWRTVNQFRWSASWLWLGLLLWLVAAWPLPRIFSTAIPHTNINVESQVVRPLASGDHLQLLYHFWLGLDAFSGHSPLGHNVYEFNLGDDSARRQPDLYYLPFSLVYMAVAPRAGAAAGWNAAGLASVLLGVWALWLLARRFTTSTGAALLVVLVAAAFPYRWITLFTGSPTGFAMAFPPLLFYGLDRAIRDRSIIGGTLAGLAIFLSYATDMHTFYFSALAAPVFAGLAFFRATPAPRAWVGTAKKIALPLLPFVLLLGAAVGISKWMSQHLADSVMAGGRTIFEVCNYSPPVIGLISTANLGMANHAYMGIPLFVLLGTSFVLWVASLFRRDSAEQSHGIQIALVSILLLGVASILLLGLGTTAFWGGLPIKVARRLIPQYTMIRQTVKIYSIMPALLVPLLALMWGGVFRASVSRVVRGALIALIAALAAWACLDALAQTTPGFCRLPRTDVAYQAVANDTIANAGKPAHALALPLWPGSSHWTSIYEYSVMLSRVRLVNGYAPAVPAGYFEDVFKKFESLNQGFATDEQLDALLELGVRHLLFHSNVFPEKVSPFAPAATLRALTGHPRLTLLADDGQTFAFRILPKRALEHAPHVNWSSGLYSAALHWNWAPPLEIPALESQPLLLRAPVFPAPHLRYLLHLGAGSTQPMLLPPRPEQVAHLTQPIAGLPDWLQVELPDPMGGTLSAVAGPVSLNRAFLAAGQLPTPNAAGIIQIPPALLFHVGHSTPGQPAVRFAPETVPAGRALYGPNLPFPPGLYDVSISYEAFGKSTAGIVIIFAGKKLLDESPLQPDQTECRFPALTIGAEPIRFEFHFMGLTRTTLHDIRLIPTTLKLVPAQN